MNNTKVEYSNIIEDLTEPVDDAIEFFEGFTSVLSDFVADIPAFQKLGDIIQKAIEFLKDKVITILMDTINNILDSIIKSIFGQLFDILNPYIEFFGEIFDPIFSILDSGEVAGHSIESFDKSSPLSILNSFGIISQILKGLTAPIDIIDNTLIKSIQSINLLFNLISNDTDSQNINLRSLVLSILPPLFTPILLFADIIGFDYSTFTSSLNDNNGLYLDQATDEHKAQVYYRKQIKIQNYWLMGLGILSEFVSLARAAVDATLSGMTKNVMKSILAFVQVLLSGFSFYHLFKKDQIIKLISSESVINGWKIVKVTFGIIGNSLSLVRDLSFIYYKGQDMKTLRLRANFASNTYFIQNWIKVTRSYFELFKFFEANYHTLFGLLASVIENFCKIAVITLMKYQFARRENIASTHADLDKIKLEKKNFAVEEMKFRRLFVLLDFAEDALLLFKKDYDKYHFQDYGVSLF